jgi:hypothetical protein
MKIAKIIKIMKFFTSFPLPFQTADIPAPRVIPPTWWGASPHLLGVRAWCGALGEGVCVAPSRGPDRYGAPTALPMH